MATGPIEKHLHRSFNWENAAPESREGTRGRSAGCGNGLSDQCVRLRSEINPSPKPTARHSSWGSCQAVSSLGIMGLVPSVLFQRRPWWAQQ